MWPFEIRAVRQCNMRRVLAVPLSGPRPPVAPKPRTPLPPEARNGMCSTVPTLARLASTKDSSPSHLPSLPYSVRRGGPKERPVFAGDPCSLPPGRSVRVAFSRDRNRVRKSGVPPAFLTLPSPGAPMSTAKEFHGFGSGKIGVACPEMVGRLPAAATSYCSR